MLRTCFLLVAVPLLFAGCSRDTSSKSSQPSGAGSAGSSQTADADSEPLKSPDIPFSIKVVRSPKSLEREQTKLEANALMTGRKFQALDALAAKYRSSKESYAAGPWRLDDVYAGLEFPRSADESQWQAHLGAFRDWIKAYPESITARVALADALTDYAWKARGGGYADTVNDEGWKLFNERLQAAVQVLNEARALREKCPYWYAVRLTTALGLQMERTRYDQLFREAIAAHPAYRSPYFRRAHYLLPRWFGEEGEWEEDLKKSADKLGGEDGDILYAQTVWQMHAGQYYRNVFRETRLSWPRADRGFDLLEKSFPESFSAKSEHAYLAILARDYGKARTYLDRLEGKVDLTVWRSVTNFTRFALSVYRRPASGKQSNTD